MVLPLKHRSSGHIAVQDIAAVALATASSIGGKGCVQLRIPECASDQDGESGLHRTPLPSEQNLKNSRLYSPPKRFDFRSPLLVSLSFDLHPDRIGRCVQDRPGNR